MFVASVSAPHVKKPKNKSKLGLFPKANVPPVEELGVHPAFRGQQATIGMVQ
jgi:hypothetical protein